MVEKYSNDAFRYVWSRTAHDPLDMDILRSLTTETYDFVKLLITASNPDLAMIDSLKKLIRSVNNFKFYENGNDSVILAGYFSGSVVGFDILFKESLVPVNVFWFNINDRKLWCNVFNCSKSNLEKFEIYLKHVLKQDNPLPLLFIDHNVLKNFKEMIDGKFDLKKRYLIDFDLESFDFQDASINRSLELQFNGTYSFKEIADTFKIDGYMDIFTSFYFYDFTTAEDEPISISDFLMESLL